MKDTIWEIDWKCLLNNLSPNEISSALSEQILRIGHPCIAAKCQSKKRRMYDRMVDPCIYLR